MADKKLFQKNSYHSHRMCQLMAANVLIGDTEVISVCELHYILSLEAI